MTDSSLQRPAPRPAPRAVIIEADGGSRGNPGPSAYGALLKDADTGEVLAEEGTRIGRATNNVAEYSGLIAGLKLAAELAPEAEIEVRMDSKLVVEQMSGRWKIKHPDMRPLAMEAGRLAPFGTTYTWVPRERNKHADRLANEALDGTRHGVTVASASDVEDSHNGDDEGAAESPAPSGYRGLRPVGPPTTLLLVRHGVTSYTQQKRFSGGVASANPRLSEEGRAQVRATAEWLRPLADDVDAVVASPVRRARESAEILAEMLGVGPVEERAAFAEMEFGTWDGLTFDEVSSRYADEVDTWLGSLDHAPGGGESLRTVEKRVLVGLDELLDTYAGRTLLVVSHVTPIKTLVARALGSPLEAVFAMELSPASVTVLSYYPVAPESGGRSEAGPGTVRPSLRLFNARPVDTPFG